ncbi:MAG: glycoside hydrolase family 3 C-terminal domain-containing protein [Candidatus Cryptobacteroides sp.]
MKRFLLIPAILMLTGCVGNGPAYLDTRQPLDRRVEDAVGRMTLEEKVALLHAQSRFSSAGVPRLGIPGLWFSDGPHGVRAEVLWDSWKRAGWTNDSCTAYPALSALAATWNPDLALLYGECLGEEARYRNKNVLLGPGCNICRTPLCGRNFEYMGEDPALASSMVVPYIRGVQSKGVAACVKHYALNNQETNRHTTNVVVSDRALNEIYLPAFKAAVEDAGVWAVMGAYNLYQGQHCCHNSRLTEILKDEWGFDGVLVSDWGGTHDTVQSIENGLDMEFGTRTDGLASQTDNAYLDYHLANPYLELLKKGEASESVLDGKVRRVLKLNMRTAMARHGDWGRFVCPEHSEAARRIGAESIVILKNEDGMLPLKPMGKLLVVGENAVREMTDNGGSSALKAKYEVSPLDGLRAALPEAEIQFVPGYPDTGEAGLSSVLEAAAEADAVIFVGGLNKDRYQDAESYDRRSLDLPYGQDRLISALAGVNRNIAVVNISGGPVAMPWAEEVRAIVQSWYLGSEAGNALADVLTGRVNPSGKLPFTIPVRLGDGPLRSAGQYPGIAREEPAGPETVWDEYYTEDIYVGYRWYEKMDIKPRFAFGFGLSYTDFRITDAAMKGRRLRCRLTNTGGTAGAEVVQVYVSLPGEDRPVKELKAFRKVLLAPGESAGLEFDIPDKYLMQYGETGWCLPKGDYRVHIGTSSDNISASFTLKI